jgi:parallel beta-helix repeat protein
MRTLNQPFNRQAAWLQFGALAVASFWLLQSVGFAATVSVDCSSASLQAAIDQAKPGDTLLVSGTCNENVRIPEQFAKITLDGGKTAAVNGPDPNGHSIEVRGRGITIKSFTVTGGRSGIAVGWGGSVLIDGNTIQNTGAHGVTLHHGSNASIINNVIQRNAGIGIEVTENSSARIGILGPPDRVARPNTIQNNGQEGIYVFRSSTAFIVGNQINDNRRTGIRVDRASHAEIASNVISSNGEDGVGIDKVSNVDLGTDTGTGILNLPNTTSAPNGGFAVSCTGGGSVSGRLGALAGKNGSKRFDSSCVDGLIP